MIEEHTHSTDMLHHPGVLHTLDHIPESCYCSSQLVRFSRELVLKFGNSWLDVSLAWIPGWLWPDVKSIRTRDDNYSSRDKRKSSPWSLHLCRVSLSRLPFLKSRSVNPPEWTRNQVPYKSRKAVRTLFLCLVAHSWTGWINLIGIEYQQLPPDCSYINNMM